MPIDVDEIYNVAGAAKAARMPEHILREAIKASVLPARKFGPRTTRIKGKDLQKWYDEHPLLTDNTPSSEEESETGGSSSGDQELIESAVASSFP